MDSVDQLAKETNDNSPAKLDNSKERDSGAAGHDENLQQDTNKQYSDITDKISKYINNNATFLQTLNQLGSLPTPDKVKGINTVYDLNQLADSLEKLKKVLTMPGSGLSERLEKDLQKLSFYHGVPIEKIIIDEMDKFARQVSQQVEKDINKKSNYMTV